MRAFPVLGQSSSKAAGLNKYVLRIPFSRLLLGVFQPNSRISLTFDTLRCVPPSWWGSKTRSPQSAPRPLCDLQKHHTGVDGTRIRNLSYTSQAPPSISLGEHQAPSRFSFLRLYLRAGTPSEPTY